MLIASTGFRYQLLANGGFPALMNDCVVRVYGGAPRPANADMAPTGTLLANITKDGITAPGHGLSFTVAPNGVVMLASGIQPQLNALGTNMLAVWCRMAAVTDPPVYSASAVRLDFGVNDSDGIGLIMADANISAALERAIPYFIFGYPPLF